VTLAGPRVRIHFPPAQSHVRTGLVKGVEMLFVGVIRLAPVTTLKIEAAGPATALIPFFFPLRPTLFLTVADIVPIVLRFCSGRQASRWRPVRRSGALAIRTIGTPQNFCGCWQFLTNIAGSARDLFESIPLQRRVGKLPVPLGCRCPTALARSMGW
jgi:hypothetical protein